MKRIAVLLYCAWLCGDATRVTASQNIVAAPNIIVFYSDDHGHADLGAYGAVTDVRTPNLDALARSGVLATNGYSTAPQCVPSRGGLMVGKFQGRFNLDNNNSSLDGFNKETTIATRLQKAGYATAQFGKWHLGPTTEISRHGFKHVFSQNAQRAFSANITLDGKDIPMGEIPPTAYHIDGCSQAAAAVIERYKDQPFFLYVAYRAPHTPLDAPKKYTDRFPGEMPERRRQALAMIAAMDDGVGLVTRTLKKHGLTDRTLVVFIGDNGAPLKIQKIDSPLQGDAGGWDGSVNTPLNGEKGMLAEGGMSTPFVVAWPGTIPGGQTYDYPITSLDVAATAVALANVPIKKGDLDGVNLLPHLKGETKSPPHDSLYWRWMAQSTIRESNWKLLRGGEREYLYDLSVDREEKNNLVSKHPDIANRLRGKLKTWADSLNPPGMALGVMNQNWDNYFDYYLEGKKIAIPKPQTPNTNDASKKTAGWLARNGTLVSKDGIMVLSSDKAKAPFIARSSLALKVPADIKLKIKNNAGGPASIAWRVDGEKDFVSKNRITFVVDASDDWQTHEVRLPATAKIIHIRIHLPGGITQLEPIQMSP
ncbi:MAG: sulfatase-like hydrolase/transferase [Planctomycetota bacterium]|nr:sulfatase-like hydrolase/transferase [Planctomycetota bacterium]